MRTLLALLCVLVLVLVACGDDAESEGATMRVGSGEYTFGESTSCLVQDGHVNLRFEAGADYVEVTAWAGVVRVRAALDGVEWISAGSATPPEVAESGVSWSGELSTGTETEQVTFDAQCTQTRTEIPL